METSSSSWHFPLDILMRSTMTTSNRTWLDSSCWTCSVLAATLSVHREILSSTQAEIEVIFVRCVRYNRPAGSLSFGLNFAFDFSSVGQRTGCFIMSCVRCCNLFNTTFKNLCNGIAKTQTNPNQLAFDQSPALLPTTVMLTEIFRSVHCAFVEVAKIGWGFGFVWIFPTMSMTQPPSWNRWCIDLQFGPPL